MTHQKPRRPGATSRTGAPSRPSSSRPSTPGGQPEPAGVGHREAPPVAGHAGHQQAAGRGEPVRRQQRRSAVRRTTRHRRTSRWCSPTGPATGSPRASRSDTGISEPAMSTWWSVATTGTRSSNQMVAGILAASSRCDPVAIRRPEARPATWPAPSSAAYPAPIPSAKPAGAQQVATAEVDPPDRLAAMPPQMHRDQGHGDERSADMNLDRAQPSEDSVPDEDLDETGSQADDDHAGEQQAGQSEQRRTADHDGLPWHEDQYAETQQTVGHRGQPRRDRGGGGEGEPAGQEGTEQQDQQGEVGPATRSGQVAAPPTAHRGRPTSRAALAPRRPPGAAAAESRRGEAPRRVAAGRSSAG